MKKLIELFKIMRQLENVVIILNASLLFRSSLTSFPEMYKTLDKTKKDTIIINSIQIINLIIIYFSNKCFLKISNFIGMNRVFIKTLKRNRAAIEK